MTVRVMMVMLTLLTLATAGPDAHAQIVNTQPLLAKATDSGFAGELRGAIDWRTGNIDLFRVESSLLLAFREGDHTVLSSSAIDYGIRSDTTYIDSLFSHLRYQLYLGEVVTWEAFGQLARNPFKRLSLRALAGTGPRWSLLPGPNVSLAIGTAYMYEVEKLRDGVGADAGREDHNHRLSVYVSGSFVLAPLITMTHTTYYQPRLDAFLDDVRIFSDTSLAFSLIETIALTLSLELSWDSAPPSGVESLDTTTTFGVVWAF